MKGVELGSRFIIILLSIIMIVTNCKQKRDSVISYSTYSTTHIDTIPLYKDSFRITDITIGQALPHPTDSTLNITKSNFSDSLIDASIENTIKKDGTLVDQTFTYKAKFPKYISRIDSIYSHTEHTTEKYKENWGLFLGVNAHSNLTNFNMVPMIHFKTKKETMFSTGFNPITKDVHVGVSVRLLGTKKN